MMTTMVPIQVATGAATAHFSIRIGEGITSAMRATISGASTLRMRGNTGLMVPRVITEMGFGETEKENELA